MAIPLAAASIMALRAGGSAWEVALPLVFVAFAVLEVALDGIKFESRHPSLGPKLSRAYLVVRPHPSARSSALTAQAMVVPSGDQQGHHPSSPGRSVTRRTDTVVASFAVVRAGVAERQTQPA